MSEIKNENLKENPEVVSPVVVVKVGEEKKYSKEELLEIRKQTYADKSFARSLKHQELLEALEVGKISQKLYAEEMQRRKKLRMTRAALRKKAEKVVDVKSEFEIERNGKSLASFTLTQQKTALSQEVLKKPLKKIDIEKCLMHNERGPFWQKKVRSYLKDMPDDVFEDRINQFAYSPCKSGVVEYWEDLMWGTRRRRDEFITFMDFPIAPEDEVAHAQGDEPVLEETSTLAGSGNMTFLEEREVDQDSSHLAPEVSSQDQHADMAERSWDQTSQVLAREIVVYRGSWTPTMNRQFLSLGLPKILVEKKTFIRRQLEVFGFLRAGIELRIQFNGNRFAAGTLVFAVLPPMFDEDIANYDYWQSMNFPHVRIDAAVSNVGVLFVPFTHILSHFPQMSGSLESDSICTLGRLVGYEINNLRLGEGAPSVLNYTVYAHFVNPELHQTTWPIESFSYSDGIITQAAEEGLFKKILGSGLGTALGAFLSKMTGGLATGLGSLLTGLIFDYPHDPMPPEPIINTSIGPTCYGAGVDHSIRLALTPISQTETTPSLLGSTNGDFNLKTLLQIPSLFDIVEWKESDSPGKLLFQMPVCPTYLRPNRVGGILNKTSQYTPTMQAYISRAFCYWRGGIILKFQLAKTEFNNGRLMIVYTPHINTKTIPNIETTDAIDTYNQANTVIVDIEEQKEFEIVFPYMSPKPWLRCDAIRLPGSFVPEGDVMGYEMSYLAESFCGFVQVFVLNKLVSPSNVTADIQMNVLISVADDFELAYPTTLSPLNITSFGLGAFGSFQEYPWLLGDIPESYGVNFINRDWITAIYHEGRVLFKMGLIEPIPDSTYWYQYRGTQYVGDTSPEVISWAYKASVIGKYVEDAGGTTGVQARYIVLLPSYNAAMTEEVAHAQGLEEYTTNRQKSPVPIVCTSGLRTAEVAPTTISENGMNLQTILRRFYCIYNSFPIYDLTAYTMITIPVNPSVTPISRAPITTNKGTFLGEAVPIDQIAWFTKLFTYWRGGLRYKISLDLSMFDVNCIHVPTECEKFSVVSGVKENTIMRLMSYAGIVATSHVQGALEVTVPYASTYEQLFVDVHNKYYDLRCQNGTLYVFMRMKKSAAMDVDTPLSFQIYRSTDEDFVMNVPKSPPQIEEPQIIYGYCNNETPAQNIPQPEAARNLGNNSMKITHPLSTGIKRVTLKGHAGSCRAKDPPDEFAEAQMFSETKAALKAASTGVERIADSVSETTSRVNKIIESGKIQKSLDSIEVVTSDLKDANIKETMASLNCVSRKIETMLNSASSTASVSITNEVIAKYAILSAEVVLCGSFVHHVYEVIANPNLPNFITLGIEFGLIVGLSVSETVQSLIVRVVDWARGFSVPEQARAQALDGATDFFEDNSKTICSVVAVLGTVLYAYLFDALPSFDKIKSVIRNFFESDDELTAQGLEKTLGFSLRNAHFSLLGIGALEKVYNKLVSWLEKLMYWFLDQENPEVVLARSAVQVRERVLALIEELDYLDYEPNFIASLEDPLVHNRYYKLQNEVTELTRACTESKVDQKVVFLLAECRKRAQILIARMEKEQSSATTRYDPFCVCIHGDAGIGKTRMARAIFQIAQRVMGLSPYNQVYSKNINDQYWSGYTKQPIVLWDEFAQSREADKTAIPEFLTLRGDKPVKVNMAALSDKGRDFSSQLLVLTTNTPYPTFNSIRDNDAFYRRRHVMIGCAFRPGFDAERLSRAAHDEFPNYEHAALAITDPMRDNVLRAGQTYAEILAYVEEEMTRWHDNQMARLGVERVEDFLPRGVVARDVDEETLEAVQILARDEVVRFDPLIDEMNELADELFVDAEEMAEAQGFVDSVKEYWTDFFDLDVEGLSAEERWFAEAWIASLESDPPQVLLRKWRNAKRCVKQGPSRLYNLASSLFTKCKDTVVNFWTNNPKVCKVLGVLALLTGVGTVMHLRSQRETESYESGPTRSSKVRVVPEHYESGPSRATRLKVVSEGCEDQQSMEISNKIKKYTYPIYWDVDCARSGRMNCIQVEGHLILAPFHFFNHANEGDFFILAHRVAPVRIEYVKTRLYRLDDKDWCVYDCGSRLETGANLSKFFIREKHLGNFKAAKCMLIVRNVQDFEVEKLSGNVKPQLEFKYTDGKYEDQYVQRGWEHSIATAPGHCGGPLLVMNSSVPSPGKILGIHVAGFKTKSIGYSVLVTYEMLERVKLRAETQCTAAPIPPEVEVGVYPDMRIIPEGDFTIVGRMPNKLSPAQPMRSTLIETPFQELAERDLGPSPRIPAKLKPFEKDGVRISPLRKAIVKYGHETIPFSQRNIKKVETYLIHHFHHKLTQHTGKRVYSVPEAVNGLPGVEFAEKMNFKSSPGWPYQVEQRVPGKWHLFDDEGNIVDTSLQNRLEQRRTAAARCQRVPSVWRDCLKDELRPTEKVESGKTRLFTIAPVDFTVLTRQMFMDFIMAFYAAQGNEFFSAVGINPESFDWTRLYNYLAQVNTKVVAGDYECFDGKEMPEIMMSVCNIINAWYNDSEENQNIRKTLFEEIIHTMQLCENTVYMTHQGNPSGNPLTTIINTIVNLFLIILAFLKIFPDLKVEDFFRWVRVIAYGDDNIIAIAEHLLSKFNQNTIAQALAEHNIVYTTEAKDGVTVADARPLNEVTFLKRGFRVDGEFGNMFRLPTMSLDTLNSYFYYYRHSPTPEEQIQDNQRSALIFAAFYGRDFYNKYLKRWQQYMEEVGMTPLQISFEEQVDTFLYCAGMVDCKPRITTWNGKGPEIESMETFMKLTNSKPVRVVGGAIEAPFYCLAAMLGLLRSKSECEPTDDRWAVAIPSGEGKSFLARQYPWLFVDHDDLLIPVFKNSKSTIPWNAEVAKKYDMPKEDRRVLLVHHPTYTNRRLVGSFITPFPTFIRMNCIQRLRLHHPIKMSKEDRNVLLVQLCSQLEPSLVDKRPRSELTSYTHGDSDLNQLVSLYTTENV